MAKAHVYLLPGANVEATDTFASWVDTTNQLVYDMGTVVLTTTANPQPNTTVGGYTTGNAHVEGILSANTLVATDGLRGGSVSSPGNLIVSSNTIFNESTLVQVGANTNNFTVNANNALFTSNVAISGTTKTFTVSAANTQFQTGSVYMKTNTEFTGSRVDIDAGVLDVTSPTTFTTTSAYFDVDTISLGANGTDSLVVNAAADFNANVNIDGLLTATANTVFSGTKVIITSSNTTIGDSTADRLNINAYLESDLIPASNAVDLGTDALPYGNVHTTYVWSDSDIESLGEVVLKGTATKTIRTTGSNGSYQNLNLTFSNNSVSNTSVTANTSGLFGGYTQLYSLGSSSVNWKELYVLNSFVTGNEVISGDLSVNGGDISTSATTFNLIDSTATTVNAFGAATTVDIGAAGGTITINNPTVVGSQTTQNLWNTTATTVNAFGAATAVNLGSTSGTMTLRNPVLVGANTTQSLFNTVATTVNAFGAATAVNLGASTGTVTVNNPTIVGSQASVNLWNTTSTTVNAFGAATTLNVANATAGQTVTIGGSSTGSSTYNVGTGATLTATTKTVNLGTGGATGSITNVNIGSSNGGSTLINSAVVGSSATAVNLWNTTSTTVNAFGAAATLNLGATTGTTTIKNDVVVSGDLSVNGGDVTTSATTFNLVNSTATTINAFGAATSLNMGAAASTIGLGKTTGNTIVSIAGNGTAGTATLTSNVTSGKFALAPSVTTGTVEVGSSTAGKASVLFTSASSSTSTGALVVAGGVGVGKNLNVANNVSIAGNLTVDGTVVFTNGNNVTLTISTGNINDLTVYDTLTFDTATISSTLTPTANVTHDIGTDQLNWNSLYVKEAYVANTVAASVITATTGAITNITSSNIKAVSGIADAVEIVASTFGSSSRKVTIKTPDSPLTANHTVTLANGNTTLQAGTMAVTGTNLSQFASTTSAQLAGVISDETGSGSLVFGTTPTITGASLITPVIGGAGATYSGSTSGSTILKAAAAAGTTTITMPATTGTIALTSDIKDATVTVTAGDGMSGGGTFTTNQASAGSITLTNTDKGSSQNIFKNVAVTGQSTVVADSNNDTLTLAGAGILAITTNATTDTVTFTATEVDTLASVTGRGATTGTAVTFTNATDSTATNIGAVVVSGGVGISKNLHVGGLAVFHGTMTTEDVVVSGNLTVNGTTTVINSTELTVDDKNIVIGDVALPSDTTADGGGITLKGTTDKTIIWDTANSNWTSSENWNIATGKTFKINNNVVLSSTSLGSSVVGSSLTSVGTITTGVWSASTIAVSKGGTGQTSYTNGQLLIGNTTGNTLTKATLTGGQNITVTNGAGSITIAAANTDLSWTAGTTAGPTVNSSTGANAVIPSASGTASGVVTTSAQTFAGTKTFSSTIVGSINGNSATVTNGVYTTGNQTIGGIKTFSSTIVGSINGNAGTATTLQTSRNINGVAFNGSANIEIGDLRHTTGALIIDGTAQSTPVNYLQVRAANTTQNVLITTAGSDVNVGLDISTKGDGAITIDTGAGNGGLNIKTGTAAIRLWDTTNTNYVDMQVPELTANSALTLAQGTTNLVAGTMVPTTGTGATGTWGISVTGNAATVTNGVYTTGNQTIGGIKTFSSNTLFSAGIAVTGNTAVTGNITATANITATGTISSTSDIKVKENVITVDNALDKVYNMRGVYYNKIGNTEREVGVIAQEVEAIIPEVVRTDDEGMKSVAYANLVGVLIEAIKELKAEIDELKANK